MERRDLTDRISRVLVRCSFFNGTGDHLTGQRGLRRRGMTGRSPLACVMPARMPFLPDATMTSAGSIGSLLAVGSLVSVASIGSIASLASVGSIASIGSVGSIASTHGVGAVLDYPVAEKVAEKVAEALGRHLSARLAQRRGA